MRNERKRIEKPLLHRVLRNAGFKAQRGPKLSLKGFQVAAEPTDVIMTDHNGRPVRRQAHRTADPDGQLGENGQANCTTSHQSVEDAGLDDVDIGGLDIVDHMSREDLKDEDMER